MFIDVFGRNKFMKCQTGLSQTTKNEIKITEEF